MSKDERDRIRDTEKNYHADIKNLVWATDSEIRELFLDRAKSTAFRFRILLGIRKLRREHKDNA